MAGAWIVRARDCRERVKSGLWVSGAEKVIRDGLDGSGMISTGIVVAAESSRVGCMRQ